MENPEIESFEARLEAAAPRLPARRVPPPRRKLVKRKKRPVVAKREPDPEFVTLSLSIKHMVNGTVYGPGVVDVPYAHVGIVRENEARNVAEERGLSEPRAAVIGPRNQKIPVHPSTFDDPTALFGLPPSIVTG